MIKYIIPIALVISACGDSETTPFCECVNASEALNDSQVKLIDGDNEFEGSDSEELKKLREVKATACKDYKLVSAEEAIDLKKACKED
ncbi:MAG: hypothetical protein P8H56_11415 [Crocinitomicaceae bacterium]|nr:hypothetical protein [Crocinitomicaceae bacterium]